MTGARESDLMEAANLLLNARRTGVPIAELPAEVRPVSVEEAYAVQDMMAEAYETIGGWKVGAPNAQTTPLFAPMPLAWIAPSGVEIAGMQSRYRGLECEIAFLVGEDLPPRATPYTRAEVIAAMESCHPAIEVIETAYIDPKAVDRPSLVADLQIHGGFVYGPAVPNWQAVDWNVERVVLAVDGAIRADYVGSNTSGDLVGLLPWLANEGAMRTGGLKRGQWITTGSWTGIEQGEPNCTVDAHFSTAGRVGLRFANPESLS